MVDNAKNPRWGGSLDGLEIGDVIGRGAHSIVYHAHRGAEKYAVKVLQSQKQTVELDEAVRFRREASILARLHHESAVQVMALGELDSKPCIVMEYIDGATLARVLADRTRLSEKDAVRVAIKLCSVLEEVHRLGLVHQDLKPQNILVDEQLERVKLIDFGLAARVRDKADNSAVGTFLYSAPEQTGVLRRPVDNRTDLYALGAVLFECVTGKPVFQSNDIAQLIHKHGFELAPSPRALNTSLSAAFSAIISRLLVKDPDERYQSAASLRADLEHLDELNARLVDRRDLDLGHEAVRESMHELPLVGRDQELKLLRQLWQETKSGKGSSVLIEGEPGSGKTRLISEVIGAAGRENNLVLRGKCIEGDPMAFNPFRASLLGLARDLQDKPDTERKAMIERIHACAKGSMEIVSRLAPTLASMLGASKEVSSLELGQDQVSQLIADFYLGLGKSFGGLLLFIDDVQWLDDASRKVLERLGSRVDDSHVFFVAASRSDTASAHALARFATEQKESLGQRIKLEMLDRVAVERLVDSYLRTARSDSRLVDLVYQRSNGSPFAIGEFLRALLEGGFLRYQWGSWLLQEGDLHQLAIPTDVLQLVVGRLENLQGIGVEVLRLSACIGTSFHLSQLALLDGMDERTINGAIEEACSSRLIEHVANDEYSFIHDRVREALILPLSDSERATLHARIAVALDTGKDERPEVFYELARHYALGLPISPKERVYHTNLKAGAHALGDAANEEAFAFLRQAAMVDEPRAKSDAYLQETLGEASLRTKRDSAAVEHFRAALQLIDVPIKRAQLRAQLLKCHISGDQLANVWSELDQAFAEVGHRPVKASIGRLVSYLMRHTWIRLLEGLGLRRVVTPGKPNELELILTQLHYVMTYAGTQFSRPLVTLQGCLGEYFHGTQSGSVRGLELAYSGYFVFLSILKNPKAFNRTRDKCLQTCEAYGDRAGFAQSKFYEAISFEFMDKPNEALTHGRDTQRLVRWMDAADTLQTYLLLMNALTVRGFAREALEAFEAMKERLSTIQQNNQGEANQNTALAAYAHAMTGAVEPALESLKQGQVFSQRLDTPFHHMIFCGNAIATHWELGSSWENIEPLITRFESQVNVPPALVLYLTKQFYVAKPFILLGDLHKAKDPKETARLAGEVKAALWKLRLASTHAMQAQYYYVAKADYLGWQGKTAAAERLFTRAEQVARETNSPLVLFEVSARRARMRTALGRREEAKLDAEMALDLAARHGWKRRERTVAEEFGIGGGLTTQSRTSVSATISREGSADAVRFRRQLQALLDVSLASANVLDALTLSRNVLDETVRLLGAQRAFLFVADPDAKLQFYAGRDNEKHDIPVAGHSRTIITKVTEAGRAIVVSSTEDGVILGSESAVAYDLRSIIAAPLRLKEKLYGVIYLDSTVAQGVFTEEDIGILNALAGHIAIALETARSAQVEMIRQAMAKDLALTAAVQALLLPKTRTVKTAACTLAGHSRAAAQSGGDWWWYEQHGDVTRIVVGDVTGHGAGSAMVTAVIAGCYRTLQRLTPDADGGALSSEMHQVLAGLGSDQYRMTLAIVEIDARSRQVRFWSAGAPPVLLLSGDACTPLALRGVPLGVEDYSPTSGCWDFKAGDRLAVFTDGLTELAVANGRQLGLRGLQRILQKRSNAEVMETCGDLEKFVDEANAAHPLEDDVTFVIASMT